ncbi:MAG: prepilin-type N-terminal cleavage/methylation domain-containing protein [Puniceicoccales bacterium]|jgi:prepilin-type N-terminal cleavage/methylation domain-containing protein|nr:prepilin-type N-terminal cleavage/methylation domain-containing protein [Puniceicoccales bacterium]
MKAKNNGFTLVEMLMAIGIGAMALTGMFEATMAYLKIWNEVSGGAQSEKFDREIVTRRFLSNELSALVSGLSKLEGNEEVTFRKLNGTRANAGDSDVCFYWQSANQIPFLEEDKGGVTEFWLKCVEVPNAADRTAHNRELRAYYRSLKPEEKSDFSGGAGEATRYCTLLAQCKGIRFGYAESPQSPSDVKYHDAPKFRNGKDPDLPDMIQILLPE